MSIAFSQEQEELRSTVKTFLAKHSTESDVRRLMVTEHGFDERVWKLAGSELEICGLAIPEELGGAGQTLVEVCIVLEELGAALTCLPYFSSVVLAQSAILESADEGAARDWLPLLASGECRGTLALAEPSGRWDLHGIQMRAAIEDGTWTLTGTKTFVLDGASADLIVVAARSNVGVSLFLVDGNSPGLLRTSLPTMDQTRKQASLTFEHTPARLLGADGAGGAALCKILDLAAIGLAAEQLGGAQRTLDMAVEYAKTRIQFGRPIGSFQAIKHKCAEMLLAVESSRSASYYAMWATVHAPDEVPVVASLAKAYCSEAFFTVAAENIQIHGGIGFTWEHPAHLYFKRAKSSELLFGDPVYHRELLAQRIGL